MAGKRFWTWMSVWFLSFFVKGELIASLRAETNAQEATSTQGDQRAGQLTPGLKIHSTEHPVGEKRDSRHNVPSGPYAKTVERKKTGSAGASLQVHDKNQKINPTEKMTLTSHRGGTTRVGSKTGTDFKNNSKSSRREPGKNSK